MLKKRLLKLADLLEKDAKNKNGIKFTLSQWGTIKDPENPVSCGTTACAMGLAAISGAFKREGLGCGTDSFGFDFYLKGEFIDGIDAAMDLFQISYAEALWLFTPNRYRKLKISQAEGERNVAKRLRAFVAGKERPSTRLYATYGEDPPLLSLKRARLEPHWSVIRGLGLPKPSWTPENPLQAASRGLCLEKGEIGRF